MTLRLLATAAALAAGLLAGPDARAQEKSTDNVLAASWMPAFCETAGGRPECRRLDAAPTRPEGRQFTLHGLWPQPRDRVYCGDAADLEGQRWSDLPNPRVTRETALDVVRVMPGAASGLHRHQWAKHGSCYAGPSGADVYFSDSVWLMQELNRSGAAALFADSIGERLDDREIRDAFDAAFGEGAGDRVSIVCRDGLIQELRLHLAGEIEAEETSLADLMLAADPVDEGCGGGRVDAPG